MPEYQYIFDDVLTKQKVGTLPLYGVSCSDFLSTDNAKAGNFTGTIRLDDRQYTPDQILDWTAPGKRRLWVERNGTLIWGGLVYTRTYQSDGRSLQISGQTFTSYPSTIFLDVVANSGHINLTDSKPYNVIRVMWRYLRNELSGITVPTYYNVGVTLEAFHEDSDGVTLVLVDPWAGDNRYLQDYIDDMLRLNAEFRIRVFYSSAGIRTAQFESAAKGNLGVKASGAIDVPVIRYPGQISKFWMTDSVAVAAHKIKGIGPAAGNNTPVYIGADYQAGYMGLTLIKNYQTTSFPTLQSSVNADVQLLKPAVQKPVYEIAGEEVDMGFSLGDHRRVVIDDPYRYPTGPVGGTVRIVGWQLTPESSTSVETLALTIDDTSQLVVMND